MMLTIFGVRLWSSLPTSRPDRSGSEISVSLVRYRWYIWPQSTSRKRIRKSMSLKGDSGEIIPKALAVYPRNLVFQSTRFSQILCPGDRTGTPWAT